jgi:oxygen-independent coproporphyrinogen-3 oxidase
MKPELAQKYDLRVPRYTSYPTAPHFKPFSGEDYGRWLGELDPALPLSLYFHIPFCDEMCWFCGCYTKIVKRYEPVAEYLESLLHEIDLVAAALPARFRARHLHWGGGSPTMLTGEDWRRIIERLRQRFDVVPRAEVAVELDPRTATEDYVAAIAQAGVNRASIGVQDFDPVVQQAIHRIQSFEVTARVIGWLRKHGIDALNMDLMYGLPHQTVERVERMADLALTLRPNRVALFGYAHVPWMKSHQKMIDESALPGTEERWRQYEAAARRLVAAGYVAIGLDHFAHPDDELAVALAEGRLHRNFQGYTTDTAPVLIGMGASAIGALPQGYVQNMLPLKDYRETVAAGRFATAKGLALSDEDRLRRDVIERLMCDLAVDLDAVCAQHGVATGHFVDDLSKLSPLAADGVVEMHGSRIVVTEAGRPLVRLAAAAFDAYLAPGEQRHSKAV